jgi:glutathione S-transferase
MLSIISYDDMYDFHAGPGGYLVGDAFTVADLTAASMLAEVANPPDSPVSRPEPLPDPLATWLGEWHDHPGTRWVRNIYAKHRGFPHDFEGPSEYPAASG